MGDHTWFSFKYFSSDFTCYLYLLKHHEKSTYNILERNVGSMRMVTKTMAMASLTDAFMNQCPFLFPDKESQILFAAVLATVITDYPGPSVP